MLNRYHNQIKLIKNKPNKKSLFIDFHGKLIILKAVDSTNENVKIITKWRRKNWQHFLTKFNVTEQGTRKWIDDIINDSGRILFFIIYNNTKIGHVGIHKYNKKNNSADIDSVLKAARISQKGLMDEVFKTMFKWMFESLGLSKIQLRVFSDNFKAINLYERVGMLTINSIPIKRKITSDGWEWGKTNLTKENFSERYLNIMEIKKDEFKRVK